VAKLLGLPYPGGPQVELLARQGNPRRFDLPRPLKGRDDCNFSFSGLKTAVREAVASLAEMSEQDRRDICASFEAAVAETMQDRLRVAMRRFGNAHPQTAAPVLVVSGGVAANKTLQACFESAAAAHGFRLIVPPAHLCTDNAAMVAWAGAERLACGLIDDLASAARARWPLDPHAEKAPGAGVKA
jgi:N6-L-threonylcarbamoyladenine synthase